MSDPLNNIRLIQQTQRLQTPADPSTARNKQEMEKACQEFESLFVSYMLQQMRQTIPEDGLIKRSQGEKIYTDMLDQEIAKTVSHNRGVGLAKIMYEQMAAVQNDEPRNK